MEGGDLKAVVLSAMTNHFNPPYSKGDALTWAMHIAEAMHYLHSVCRPMIIHRDLKLDNVLLTGGPLHSSVVRALPVRTAGAAAARLCHLPPPLLSLPLPCC